MSDWLVCIYFMTHTHIYTHMYMYLYNICYMHIVMMHISYRSKGSTPNKVFHEVQEKCFLWERVASFWVDFGLFHFVDLLHAQKCYLTK